MATLTKAALVAQIEALRLEVTTLHLMLEQERSDRAHDNERAAARLENAKACYQAVKAEVVALKADIINVTAVASAINVAQKPARPAYVMPAWQLERKAAMDAAKAEALATRACVRA